MDIVSIVEGIKNNRITPSKLEFLVDPVRNMARVRGFQNHRFDSVAILYQAGKIKLMLIMSNRLVHVPSFGYLGVKSFSEIGKAAVELERLSRLR